MRKNPARQQHERVVSELLASAHEHLDNSLEMFEGGDPERGWSEYLEAFAEIARAQQEIVHASEGASTNDLDVLDDFNATVNRTDAMVRSGLSRRLSSSVEIDQLFDVPTQTAIIGQQLRVPVSDWLTMRQRIAQAMVQQYGSIRSAAPVLGVPRSTLQAWLTGSGGIERQTSSGRRKSAQTNP